MRRIWSLKPANVSLPPDGPAECEDEPEWVLIEGAPMRLTRADEVQQVLACLDGELPDD